MQQNVKKIRRAFIFIKLRSYWMLHAQSFVMFSSFSVKHSFRLLQTDSSLNLVTLKSFAKPTMNRLRTCHELRQIIPWRITDRSRNCATFAKISLTYFGISFWWEITCRVPRIRKVWIMPVHETEVSGKLIRKEN